jgi:hypothetical protein
MLCFKKNNFLSNPCKIWPKAISGGAKKNKFCHVNYFSIIAAYKGSPKK